MVATFILNRKEVVRMDTYQTISLMIGFGMLILTLISLIVVIVKTVVERKK